MAGPTMVIGSKLALPLVLQLQVDHMVRSTRGSEVLTERLRKFDPSPKAERHVIAGFARSHAKVPSSIVVGAHRASDGGTIGGYAISYVPKDFWDKWVAQNPDFEPLEKQYIIAFEKKDAVEGTARERVEVMSGMEPFDPSHPPPEFTAIVPADAY